MLSQLFVWITGHLLFKYVALARIWLEMVNACDLVSYDILESHCVSGKGGFTITKQSSSYLDHFLSCRKVEKAWYMYIISHDHDQELITAIKVFIISFYNMDVNEFLLFLKQEEPASYSYCLD